MNRGSWSPATTQLEKPPATDAQPSLPSPLKSLTAMAYTWWSGKTIGINRHVTISLQCVGYPTCCRSVPKLCSVNGPHRSEPGRTKRSLASSRPRAIQFNAFSC